MIFTDTATTILNGHSDPANKSIRDYYNDYTAYMGATGRSKSAIDTQNKHIRAVINVSDYEWNTDFLNMTDEQNEELFSRLNHFSRHYRMECISSFKHFMDYIREQQGLDLKYSRPSGEWVKKSGGRYRFVNELEGYREYLESTGMVKEGAYNKALRAKNAIKVLDGMYSFSCIADITYEMFMGLEEVVSKLEYKTQGDILYTLDDFIKHYTGKSIYKAAKEQEFKGRYKPEGDLGREFTEWRDKYCDDLYEANWRRSVEAKRKELTLTYGRFNECFGPLSIFQIDYHHFRKIVPFMGKELKQITIRGYLVNFGMFLKFVTGNNPMEAATLAWSQDIVKREFITVEEWLKITPHIKKEHRAIFLMGSGLGLRRTEIANLKLSDLDMSKDVWTLHVNGKGKGSFGKSAILELDDFIQAELKDYLEYRSELIEKYGDRSEGRLFLRDSRFRGTPLSNYNVGEIITETGKRAGVKISPHVLRRYFCMSLVMDNVPEDTIRRQMRHKHFETTADHYIGDLTERKDLAKAAVRKTVYAGF